MKNALIVFIWVVHISALIGLALGYEVFFLEKSPFTMILLLLALVVYFPVMTSRSILLFIAFTIVGITVEWIGVHTSYLFGTYSYGDNFGPKLDGIPYLIGVNWALLTFCSHEIAQRFLTNKWGIAAIGASLMVFLDLFLEQICNYAGFWTFENGAGWFNYLCWFVIAFGLHLIAHQVRLRGDLKISAHLYTVQLTFATALWIILSTT